MVKGTLKRKQVFKSVLDNAYTASVWPFVDPEVASLLLDLLEVLFQPLNTFNRTPKGQKSPQKPTISDQVTLGFNSTVKALEKQVFKKSDLVIVFVCKLDLQPAALTSFFPSLAYTSSQGGSQVNLVQLPKGSMARLSSMTGIPNTGIVGLQAEIPGADEIYRVVNEKIDNVHVPWLEQFDLQQFAAPNIRFIQTSAPIKPPKSKQKPKKVTKQAP
ncbi:ribonucleases P/MRP protein subunit Pop3p [Diutina catenulata]